MTPKLLPGATDILRCVREVTRDLLAPALTGLSERSATATIDHMLRYVEQLIDHEGQVLLDEEARLAALLPRAIDWLARNPRHEALTAAIRADLDRKRDPAIYPTLGMMEDRVAALRQHVCDILVALQGAEDAEDEECEAVHEQLRNYIRWQLENESRLIEPAFLGHGPRR